MLDLLFPADLCLLNERERGGGGVEEGLLSLWVRKENRVEFL